MKTLADGLMSDVETWLYQFPITEGNRFQLLHYNAQRFS